MPAPLQAVAALLPLSHAIDIARPLLTGQLPANLFVHVAVLIGYAVVAYYIALVLTRRRLLK
jgi:lipooligosaccharide transport system permease protein